ncbi:hypothetical protein NQZ79_g324 [Umbelopsis isabellina]|nr:hypothetical protein NQZ79_g324 [Umbelopsis isabellina]
MAPAMQTIADLTTRTRATTGDIPPPLVGATTTVIGNEMLVFAGRLVTTRRMTNDMYVLNLDTMVWTRFIPPPGAERPPRPRYFHSANVHNNQLVVFGGMGYSRSSEDGLCALDDVCIFDVSKMEWRYGTIAPTLYNARARYAHLSSVSGNLLVIVGGQDMNNQYIPEINVFDIEKWEWIQVRPLSKQCGAYRSICVSADLPAGFTDNDEVADYGFGNEDPSKGATGKRQDSLPKLMDQANYRMSYNPAATPSTSSHSPIFLYSNYNFTDVKRELQVFLPPMQTAQFQIQDRSTEMSGSALPPGLRFPTAQMLGYHMILAGTYLTPQKQAFQLWSLNVSNLIWTKMETGATLSVGSWNRGVLYEAQNQFLVFGNRDRSLLDDYNHRQINFEHVVVINTECFGIYQPPKPSFAPIAQEMGLSMLNDPSLSDFEIATRDGITIPVNSMIISRRWPYFKNIIEGSKEDLEIEDHSKQARNSSDQEVQPVMRKKVSLSPSKRTMLIPEPYSVVFALLQFLYADNLLTAQQHQPIVLAQLLILSDMYSIPRLKELASHALHQMLTLSTATLIYETAALSNAHALQVRALKVMINAKKAMSLSVANGQKPTGLNLSMPLNQFARSATPMLNTGLTTPSTPSFSQKEGSNYFEFPAVTQPPTPASPPPQPGSLFSLSSGKPKTPPASPAPKKPASTKEKDSDSISVGKKSKSQVAADRRKAQEKLLAQYGPSSFSFNFNM